MTYTWRHSLVFALRRGACGWLPLVCRLSGRHLPVVYNPWLSPGRSIAYCLWCRAERSPAIPRVVSIQRLDQLRRHPDGSVTVPIAAVLEPGEMAVVELLVPLG